jgi:hypothetical protein
MSLAMLVGLICSHIIITNFKCAPLGVFLGYSNMHKVFNCLDVSKGRIYISWDVMFDETVFPFASLHSTANTRYHSNALLIPVNIVITDPTNVSTCSSLPVFDVPVQLQQISVPGGVPVGVTATPQVQTSQ